MLARLLLPLALIAPVLPGCGGGKDLELGKAAVLDDAQKIGVVVSEISDISPLSAAKLFTADAKPNQATIKKIATMAFVLDGKPKIDGTTATATVKIRSQSNAEKELGSKEWSFVKEGETWKVKSAPLP